MVLDDGVNKRTVLLNRPFYGLHIPPGIWASEQGFSSGSICLVLTSHRYEARDYIRDYEEYLIYTGNHILTKVKYGGVKLNICLECWGVSTGKEVA